MLYAFCNFFSPLFLSNSSSYLTSDLTSDHFFFFFFSSSSARRGAASFLCVSNDFERAFISASVERMTKMTEQWVLEDFLHRDRAYRSSVDELSVTVTLSTTCTKRRRKKKNKTTNLPWLFGLFNCYIMYVLFYSFDVYHSVKRLYLYMPWNILKIWLRTLKVLYIFIQWSVADTVCCERGNNSFLVFMETDPETHQMHMETPPGEHHPNSSPSNTSCSLSPSILVSFIVMIEFRVATHRLFAMLEFQGTFSQTHILRKMI